MIKEKITKNKRILSGVICKEMITSKRKQKRKQKKKEEDSTPEVIEVTDVEIVEKPKDDDDTALH